MSNDGNPGGTHAEQYVDGNGEPVRLTDRQRQVWEMTTGTGKYAEEGRIKAPEIAERLGISANAVYVTRRRVKQILGVDSDDGGGRLSPKRIIRQESRLQMAIEALEAELTGSLDEEATLMARVDQLRHERPEVERVLNDLKSVVSPDGRRDGDGEKEDAGAVAA